MTDPAGLARRAADLVATLAARAGNIVSWWTIAAAVIALGSLWAGIQALDGGILTIWVVLGVVFGWISVVGMLRLRWNLAMIRHHADDLVDEVRQVLEADPTTERTVIEAVEVGEHAQDRTVMVFSQQFSGLGGFLGPDRRRYRALSRVIDTMRSGFMTLAKSFVITVIFAMLGVIFLIALVI